MKPLLILDCHYLSHRAFYTTGGLSFEDVQTGVVFGFFKEIISLMEIFNPGDIVFCFDAKGSIRKEKFPAYKQKRHGKERPEEELKTLFELKRQITKLRTEYLPMVGYNNVFWQDGYEADDIIATTAAAVPEDEEAIIVGADKDLFQLLRPNVRIYHPILSRSITVQTFTEKYRIPPKRWAQKLAIAGCHTDEVPGIPGIGETRALKYIRGELKPTSAAYLLIESTLGRQTIARNKELVKLPLLGARTFEITHDNVTAEGWQRVCGLLGMKSLAGQTPSARRPRATFGL